MNAEKNVGKSIKEGDLYEINDSYLPNTIVLPKINFSIYFLLITSS